MDKRWWVAAAGIFLAGSFACGLSGTGPLDSGVPDSGAPDAGPPLTGALKACEWNLEWFGDTSNGPSNDALQQQNVTDVIADAGCDLFAVEEVVDSNVWNQVVANLQAQDGESYGSVLATDPGVANAGTYEGAQKVGLLYRKGLFDFTSADVLGSPVSPYDFAGRPPLEVKLGFHTPTGTVPLTVIVVHLKAQFNQTDSSSYTERVKESGELKSYLDASHPSDRVMVMGDWNDDLNQSIYQGDPSPYENFTDAGTMYEFPTAELTAQGISTTVSHPAAIDHHMITNELFGNYVQSSAQVLHPQVSNYGTTTSDHYPTVVRYQF